jgi:3-hydroxyacyl-[acyl-carrier-protein] dehydratase
LSTEGDISPTTESQGAGTGGDLPAPAHLLPHRPPFLFVDELVDIVPGERISGRWHLTGDEWFFPGHFPGRPTLPGVLMVEALAQLGACALLSDERYQGKLPLFGGADKVKFRRQVVPGETLDLTVELGRVGARAGKGHGIGTVEGQTAVQVDLMFVLVDP